MNIDLFQTQSGQCGVVCHGKVTEPPAGVLFDAEVMEMTLEFVNQEPLHMNINVDISMRESLLDCPMIYFGAIDKGIIIETLNTPLMILNDPFEGGTPNLDKSLQTLRSVQEFDFFMKESTFAQAVHRDDLGKEDDIRSVMHGHNLKSLSYSGKLERARKLEHAPQIVSTPMAVPNIGLGGASNVSKPRNDIPPPSSKGSSDED